MEPKRVKYCDFFKIPISVRGELMGTPLPVASEIQWHVGEPNGKDEERCVVVKEGTTGYLDFDCKETICSYCVMPESNEFILR